MALVYRPSPAIPCPTGAGTASHCRKAGLSIVYRRQALSKRVAIPVETIFLPALMLSVPGCSTILDIMNLGRLRLMRPDGRVLVPNDITGLKRTLDLWAGVQTSHYQIAGQEVNVETCVHPSLDLVAVRIESPLVAKGELEVALDFAYPSLENSAWVGDFNRTSGHATIAVCRGDRRIDFTRRVDAVTYHAALAAEPGCSLRMPGLAPIVKKLVIKHAEYGAGAKWADVTAKVATAVKDDRISQLVDFQAMSVDPAPGVAKRMKVTFTLDGVEGKTEVPDNQTLRIPAEVSNAYTVSAHGRKVMSFVCAFSAGQLPSSLPSCTETKTACGARWEKHWSTGGAIDLSASKDPRWKELERRIVLSQYLMAAMSAGSWPSSENGLMGIDAWRGQFHMEMVWWHLAHYALWDRWNQAEKAMRCYQRFTPAARELAAQLGYKGLKWQKSVGPEGRSAPWVGNQVLLWKQPHPIFFAELEYRLRPTAPLSTNGPTLSKVPPNIWPTTPPRTKDRHLFAHADHAAERTRNHPRHRIRPGVLALGPGQGPGVAAAPGTGT